MGHLENDPSWCGQLIQLPQDEWLSFNSGDAIWHGHFHPPTPFSKITFDELFRNCGGINNGFVK